MFELIEISKQMLRFHDLDILKFDDAFVKKSMKYRMNNTNCKTTKEYSFYLENHPNELQQLYKDLNNTYSEFFRNQLTFAYLEQIVLPSIIKNKLLKGVKELRIWSCASADGQEAYSIAILLSELLEVYKSNLRYSIFATDVNAESLQKAKIGNYHSSALGKVAINRIKKHFTKSGDNYTVKNHLKEFIDFSLFDLLSNQHSCPPSSIFGNFDIVFCSNLLFYYKSEYQTQILSKASNCVALNGFFITSETEREILQKNNFTEVYPFSGIFKNPSQI